MPVSTHDLRWDILQHNISSIQMESLGTSLEQSSAHLEEYLISKSTSYLRNAFQTKESKEAELETELESLAVSGDLLVGTPVEAKIEPKKSLQVPTAKKKRRIPRGQVVIPKTFGDKYHLENKVIGKGAQSSVELARDKSNGDQFAVKILEKYEGYDRNRIFKELDVLHLLRGHPNIVELVDFYEEDKRFYLVFEQMEGGPLLTYIEQNRRFTEKQASMVTKNIANALCHAHSKGIAHRDLKPENILCQFKYKVDPVKICDFDLASGIPDADINGHTPELFTPVGSAEYMAPEVVEAFVGDAPAYDKKCDLWSLGVIIYIMLSGKPPFVGTCDGECDWETGGSCRTCLTNLWHCIQDGVFSFPEDDWGTISDDAKDLIQHLLVKDACKRYNASEVLTHSWIHNAPDTPLQTPTVLRFSDKGFFSSEVMAYSRILAEQRQSSIRVQQKNRTVSKDGSPGFGLSPPGNSKLAKRRAEQLKKKESLPLFDSESQSPDVNAVNL